MRFGLILAAGRGERFGAPKQRMMLGGHPLALWSILAFEGGTERIDSLHAGLKALPKEGFVAVHDAARPFVRAEEITEGFKVVKTKGSAIYAIPVTDTIKCVEGDVVLETVPRDCLYRAQTPQFFGLPILRQALAKAEAEGFIGTDEASYVERLGEKIHILPGREENIKITFPQDLELAENLLAAGTCP
jgi:2-C-methyl-D-erythritol 4-phosphate cytidylyltransferase